MPKVNFSLPKTEIYTQTGQKLDVNVRKTECIERHSGNQYTPLVLVERTNGEHENNPLVKN